MSSNDWILAICLPFQAICLALIIYFNHKASKSWKEAERNWARAEASWRETEANWDQVADLATHRRIV